MTKFLPKVFVGSSSEAKEIVEGFCEALKENATMVRWWLAQDFKPMKSTLDGLWEASARYDFGLFILTPDDEIISRGEENYSARDNVLFELGLFLGKLGSERVFAVIQQDADPEKKIKVLSDLAGYIIPRFAKGDPDQLISSISSTVIGIRRTIKDQGRKKLDFKLAGSWDYDNEKKIFTITLSAAKIIQHKVELKDKKFILIARKQDEDVNLEDDTNIARSIIRKIPVIIIDRDVILKTHCENVFVNIKEGDIIEGHILLVPESIDDKIMQNAKTMSELIDLGCDILESVGKRVNFN